MSAATPAEAEELAKKAVGGYLTACRLADRDPVAIGNVGAKRGGAVLRDDSA